MNGKICVKSFFCQSCEDDYFNGCGLKIDSSWDESGFGVAGKTFDSVDEALKAVCKENCFDYEKDGWERFDEDYPDATRFDSCFMVDEDNSQASSEQIEEWKKGERRLWCCNVSVWLCVRQDLPIPEDTK